MKTLASIFITGTGTGVGKTLFTAGLARMLCSRALRVAVVKPVQTGTSDGADDIGLVRKICPESIELPRHLSSPYSFAIPASPHLASRREGVRIEIRRILSCLKRIEDECHPDIILIEGAGGLMVPLNEKEMMADLIRKTKARTILVADSGLGTLNHTFLSLKILREMKIEILGVVLNRYPAKPGIVEKDNVRTIGKLGSVPILALVGKVRGLNPQKPSIASIDREFRRHNKLVAIIVGK